MAHYFHSNDKRFMYMKISSVYPREVDMIKMTLNSARESCTLLPSAAAMCGDIFSSGGRGGRRQDVILSCVTKINKF